MKQPDRPLLYINAMRGLSHELRNALTAVAGFSDLLQARMQDDTDRFMLKQVQDGAARIHAMLDAVVRFTVRPGRGVSGIDLSQSVKDAWELAVWQHRGNMAVAQLSLETALVEVDIMVCHEFLLFLFGTILEIALHTAPVEIALGVNPQHRVCLTASWTSFSENEPDFSGLLAMAGELRAEMRLESGLLTVVFPAIPISK